MTEILVAFALPYVAIGLGFATWFVGGGMARLDGGTEQASLGVRLLLLPGALAFWPLLYGKCLMRS